MATNNCKEECPSFIQDEDLGLFASSRGLRVLHPLFEGERFVEWDNPGPCTGCKTKIVNLFDAEQNYGILIDSTRLKHVVFLAFDNPVRIGNDLHGSTFQLR